MATSMTHQKDAVASATGRCTGTTRGGRADHSRSTSDSKAPSIPLRDFAARRGRFAMLRAPIRRAPGLLALAQHDVDERWRYYEQLAGVEAGTASAEDPDELPDTEEEE
jgi:pyruvate-ferredoxin/flavodoxin oxidoreductase